MNLFSMTGFGSAEQSTEKLMLTVDLKAVNHRFLDISFKLPDELRQLEQEFREYIAGHMKRGKLDCRIYMTIRSGATLNITPDSAQIAALLEAEKVVRQIKPDARPLSVADVLRWPGVLATQPVSAETLKEAVFAAFYAAWQAFTASRAREGQKLVEILSTCCDAAEALIAQITPRIPAIHEVYRERLATRLREAMLDPDEDRIRQELALFAVRVEISEEVARLTAHINEIRRVLQPEGEIYRRDQGSHGKRLDFLAQELHREANTLGAKSPDTQLSQVALELKVLIEQMREQIQNIE
ncbi:MAG: YicC family protein [Burkholderiales bacterium]|jgi:uncharacterized protein (TIGR00255 family)|nr:YicC family protein [Burkholderiales bacterium]